MGMQFIFERNMTTTTGFPRVPMFQIPCTLHHFPLSIYLCILSTILQSFYKYNWRSLNQPSQGVSQYSLSPSPDQTLLLQYSALIFVYMALHTCATILVLAVSPLIKLGIHFQSSAMFFLHMLA